LTHRPSSPGFAGSTARGSPSSDTTSPKRSSVDLRDQRDREIKGTGQVDQRHQRSAGLLTLRGQPSARRSSLDDTYKARPTPLVSHHKHTGSRSAYRRCSLTKKDLPSNLEPAPPASGSASSTTSHSVPEQSSRSHPPLRDQGHRLGLTPTAAKPRWSNTGAVGTRGRPRGNSRDRSNRLASPPGHCDLL